jgi:U3 small nucleolar RNA-associated protein 14
MAKELPHMFENRQQYERSLRLPIGQEWYTSDTCHDESKPRVLVKQGSINPMERPHA